MKHTQATTQASGKNQMLVLLIMGILGVAGLFYVLNSSNDKTGFSEKQQPQKIEWSQYAGQGEEQATIR